MAQQLYTLRYKVEYKSGYSIFTVKEITNYKLQGKDFTVFYPEEQSLTSVHWSELFVPVEITFEKVIA
jgi:hypothetical protein